MYTLNVWKDPYGDGRLCSAKTIDFEPGITVLVGCNGSGKTTMLFNIEQVLKKENIPVYLYNSARITSDIASASMFSGDYATAAEAMSSSEGENISLGLMTKIGKLRSFIQIGRVPEKFDNIFLNDDVIKKNNALEINDKRFILFDSTDSGYSIDNMIELKSLFNAIINDGKQKDKDVFIIVTSNQYEMSIGQRSIDITTGEYIEFKDYDDYKKYILKTRTLKDKRYERINKKREKKKQEEENKKQSQETDGWEIRRSKEKQSQKTNE